MTTLAALSSWNQFAEGYSARDSCGAHAVASCLAAAQRSPGLAGVEAFVGLGETNVGQLIDGLRHFGAAGAQFAGAFYSAVGTVLAAGRYPIVLVQSDSAGHPVARGSTGIDHWVAVYADEGAVVRIANSGSGKDESYPSAYFVSCFAGDVIDSGCAPVAPPTTGEDDVPPTMLLNLKRMPIWMVRLRHENWPPGQGDVDSFAAHIADDLSNMEDVMTALEQTFETNHQPSEMELLAAVRAKVGAS